jgi:hypothetical protein
VAGAGSTGFVSWDTANGYAACFEVQGQQLYIGRCDGAGGITAVQAAFDLTDTTMKMYGMGIRYPNAAYGSNNAFAFGWYTGPPAATYAGVSISVDNGAAWWPVANGSDARMKTDIAPSRLDALEVINKIQLREFRWIDVSEPSKLQKARADKKIHGSLKRIGLVAQEVAKIFPEAVQPGDDHEDKLGAVWQIEQNIMIAALIGSVQQLTARVAELETGGGKLPGPQH